MVTLESWASAADATAMQQLASRCWPIGPHAGGLAWEWASDQLPAPVMLARQSGAENEVTDSGRPVLGWAGVSGAEVVLHVDGTVREAGQLLLDWAVGAATSAGDSELTVNVVDGDSTLRIVLLDAGFATDVAAPPVLGMFRPAIRGRVMLPAGYRIRAVRDDEEQERVAVHRASWLPANLPWAPSFAPVAPSEATSTFTVAHYRRLRATWLYNAELDLVVEAPGGSLVGCCTLWWDEAAGCAEIEPLGVVPEHRRMGLASALCMAAVGLVAGRGGSSVFINTGPREDYPAPAATYASVGFEAVVRARAYRLSGEREPAPAEAVRRSGPTDG